MYQYDAGNMFLVNSDWAGTNLNSGSWPQIQSIDVTSVTDGYHGAMTQDDFQSFVCFTRGTLIKTDQGERPIEDLAAADMVLTMDHEYQPIRWIGSSKRAAKGDLAPILIRKGALGNDRDLRVSSQHRMLLQGWQAEMLFGEVEVLATAKSLLNDHSILRDEGGEVEYFHMLFDRHEIIYAEGCLSESFHPGKQGWNALDRATRDEILTLFSQLADGNFNDYGSAARMSLKHKEGKLLGSYMAGSSCLLVCYNITNDEIDDWRRDVGERGEALQAKMLGIFGKQPEPISAYALLDELKKTNAKIAPPTVYRALSALVNSGRIHRLESLNAYVVCQHGDHQNAPILSICDDCGSVEETIALDLVADISSNIGQTGFVAERHVIEVHGTCGSCTSEKEQK